jgi:hypothetical protein
MSLRFARTCPHDAGAVNGAQMPLDAPTGYTNGACSCTGDNCKPWNWLQRFGGFSLGRGPGARAGLAGMQGGGGGLRARVGTVRDAVTPAMPGFCCSRPEILFGPGDGAE